MRDATESDVVSQSVEPDTGRVAVNGPRLGQQLELLAFLNVSGNNRKGHAEKSI